MNGPVNTAQFNNFQGTCTHCINHVELVADADGALYWPAAKTVLVADLHFEKGSSFARRGQLLPPYDTGVTLQRLAVVLERWQPRRVIALGDSFHDQQAVLRLCAENREMLRSLMQKRDWIWITGNHDPIAPASIEGECAHEVHEGGLILRHEPLIDHAPGEIAGHLHPTATILRRGHTIKRSCFAVSNTRMIMPSFGAYTGGLDVFHSAFDGLFDERNFHVLMRGDGQVYRIHGKHLK